MIIEAIYEEKKNTPHQQGHHTKCQLGEAIPVSNFPTSTGTLLSLEEDTVTIAEQTMTRLCSLLTAARSCPCPYNSHAITVGYRAPKNYNLKAKLIIYYSLSPSPIGYIHI